MAKARTRPASLDGPLAEAEAALARGDTRRGRAILRRALAASPGLDRTAAQGLLERTRPDPAALAVAAAVLLVLVLAAWFGLFHRAA